MQQSQQSGEAFFQLLSNPAARLELRRRPEPGPRPAGCLQQPARPRPEPECARADGRRAGGGRTDADPPPERAHRDRLERHPGRRPHPDRGRDHHDLQRDGIPVRQRHPLDPDRQARDPEGPEGRGRGRAAAAPGNFMPANATDYLNQATLVTKLNADHRDRSDHRRDPRPAARLDHDRGHHAVGRADHEHFPADATGDRYRRDQFGRQRRNRDQRHDHPRGLFADRSAPVPERRSIRHGQDPADHEAGPGDLDTTFQVAVRPVPGEQITTNNTATYTVVFSS